MFPLHVAGTALLMILRLVDAFAQSTEGGTTRILSSSSTCTGIISYIGDGHCNGSNNNAECEYDGGDCCECTCEAGDDFFCNSSFDCQDPDVWCPTTTAPSPSSACMGTVDYIGDGGCDTWNNNEECEYDGGDCCECTCEDGEYYTCGPIFDDCIDPLANCLSPIATPSPAIEGSSTINAADGTTSGSTSGISTAVIASICVAGAVLIICIIALCVGPMEHQKRRGGGENGANPTSVADNAVLGPPPAFEGHVNTAVGTTVPMSLLYAVEQEEKGAGLGAVTSNTAPSPFRENMVGKVCDKDVEVVRQVRVEPTAPEGPPAPPSYEQVVYDPGQ